MQFVNLNLSLSVFLNGYFAEFSLDKMLLWDFFFLIFHTQWFFLNGSNISAQFLINLIWQIVFADISFPKNGRVERRGDFLHIIPKWSKNSYFVLRCIPSFGDRIRICWVVLAYGDQHFRLHCTRNLKRKIKISNLKHTWFKKLCYSLQNSDNLNFPALLTFPKFPHFLTFSEFQF